MASVLEDAYNKFTNEVQSFTTDPTSSSFSLEGKSFNFPTTLKPEYSMSLRFYKYQRISVNEIGKAILRNTINLPIPATLLDGQAIEYGEEAIAPGIAGIAGALGGGVQPADAAKAAGVGAVTGAAGSLGIEAISSAMLGITANPFLTVLFKNPKYKTYDFSWRLFPRNEQESKLLQLIYLTVKYHSLPTRSEQAGGAILYYPSLILPQINAGKNTWMFPFKYGVVTNFVFNFTADGTPSFHKGGEPVAVDMKISIQEVEYFLKNSMNASTGR